jgi:RNA polymerase sigma-70 factor (ECF subfamily)
VRNDSTEMTDQDAAELVARWQQGDQVAAAALFACYGERLIALARSRLSEKLVQRFDPEDVVQSAYRSFFAGARAGRYSIERGGDLWQLLVTITLRKLHHRVRWNSTQKRAVQREQSGASGPAGAWLGQLAQEPSPIEAVALVDEVERIMRQLAPVQRRMFELRLQGYKIDEIAAAVERGERTVRRLLDQVKQLLDRETDAVCAAPVSPEGLG